jgi:hypothetical protein
MNLKRKLTMFVYMHVDFPIGVSDGVELNWILKNNCPCCINQPLESLSNYDYKNKYPAKNKIILGNTTVYLCDCHLKELREILNGHL